MSATTPSRDKEQPYAPSIASSVQEKEPNVTSSIVDDGLVEADPKPFKFTDWLFRRNQELVDLDSTATRRSIYDDPDLGKYYWPKASYENLHRFDPKARWTWREQNAVVRKIDWKVMLWAAISFSALNLDRNNLTQANSDNFLPDLGMDTDGSFPLTLSIPSRSLSALFNRF
ncbi:hypothetical protein H0H93_006443 [Arthromyces matolae]|nr:hypothetical protein H0H93_006443 [Arthromyces matolae]